MADENFSLALLGKQLTAMRDEMRAMRLEMRRMAENQQMIANAIRDQRDSLELVIRTEIGGLFAHLETRLEQRIEDAIHERTHESS